MGLGHGQGNGNSYFIHVKTIIRVNPKLRNSLELISIRNDIVLR